MKAIFCLIIFISCTITSAQPCIDKAPCNPAVLFYRSCSTPFFQCNINGGYCIEGICCGSCGFAPLFYGLVIGIPVGLFVLCIIGCIIGCIMRRRRRDQQIVVYQTPGNVQGYQQNPGFGQYPPQQSYQGGQQGQQYQSTQRETGPLLSKNG